MKLYILTSTLNLNSFLASESCLPKGFYALRGYGDSYFYNAGSFVKENTILLYDKYPVFKMPITEEEQFSLVIEIDTERCTKFAFNKVSEEHGIYQTDSPIYLNPFGTSFLFASNSDMNQTIAKVNRSLDSKSLFFNKYNCFKTIEYLNIPKFEYKKEVNNGINDFPQLNTDLLQRDRILNKLKGFLYAFIIGANNSPGEDIAKLKQYTKEINNVVNARIVNSDFAYSPKLETLCPTLNKIINEIDPERIHFEKFSNDLHSNSNDVLEKFQKHYPNQFRQIVQGFFAMPDYHNITTIEKLKAENDRIESFISRLKSQHNNPLTDNEIPTFRDGLVSIKDSNLPTQEVSIYEKWINEFLKPEKTLHFMFSQKIEYPKIAGTIAKDFITDFDKSTVKSYLNSLIMNIRSAEEFNPLSVDSIIWRSLAMCAKASKTEIEALERLLNTFGISEYRFAMGILGALCGYADMPKTFFNQICSNIPNDLAIKYVRLVAQCVFDFEIDLNNIQSLSNHTIETISESRSTIANWQKDILTFFNSLKNVKEKSTKEESLKKTFQKYGDQIFEPITFFNMLKTDYHNWIITSGEECKAFKDMVKKFCPKIVGRPIESTKTDIIDPIGPTDNLFIYDKNINNFVDGLSYIDSPIRSIVKNKIWYMQKEYVPNGNYGDEKKHPRDNNSTIDHLYNMCFAPNSKNKLSINEHNENVMKRLINDLKGRYDNI